MSECITKITKKEAEITARLYIASMFIYQDVFNTDTAYSDCEEFSSVEVNDKITIEIKKQIQKILKGLDVEIPNTALACIIKAKEIVK